MNRQDMLNALPADLFPQPLDGRCNARVMGSEGGDLCGRPPQHKGSHTGLRVFKRQQAKRSTSSRAAKLRQLQKLAEELEYKLPKLRADDADLLSEEDIPSEEG